MPGKTGYKHPTRIYTDPEQMWDDFQEFVGYTKENHNKKFDHKKVLASGEIVNVKTPNPISVRQFIAWTIMHKGYSANKYIHNENGLYDDFRSISKEIKAICAADIEHGVLNKIYDAGAGSKILGLVDQKEINANVPGLLNTSNLIPKEENE